MGGVVVSFGRFTSFHPPAALGRPRIATWVDSGVARGLAVSSVPTSSPLLIEVSLFSPSGICTPTQRTLRVLNVHNPLWALASTALRFNPSDIFPPETAATLVARDLNLHH